MIYKVPKGKRADCRWKVDKLMQISLLDQTELLLYLKEQLLPEVLAQGRKRGRVLRIWSVGCQTGDEAATLALLLSTLLGNQMPSWQIRIFATDLDPMVSALARGKVYGRYPLRSTFSEDKQHLFERTPHGYRLIKGLRDLIIFAPHDLLHQPPFPQLDLVVCHHPLSQLSVEEQATLLNRFAYVLSARCHLFLVPDSTVLPNPGYYERIDSSRQVYVRTEMPVPIQTLRLQYTRAPRENADTSQYTADLDLVEELQVALEELEVTYQELEQRTQDLETANEELEKLNCLKDEFISLASHELRTPLTVILGLGELLRIVISAHGDTLESSLSLALQRRSPIEVIDKILAQGNMMVALINELLDVSRLHADVFALTKRGIGNIADLVSRVVEQQATATGRQIIVETAHQPLIGNWDERRLEQVLTNLLTNALKFSAAETTVTVTLRGEPATGPAEEVLIAVHDQGCGISQEQQKHLFERFYRARTHNNATVEGLGLGLYVAGEIVKRHAGRIWVESTIGAGSTFFVSLPLVRAEEALQVVQSR